MIGNLSKGIATCFVRIMSTEIITTKLFKPSPPPNLVSRPRLLHRLESGATGKLTLISAQAGFGKTTLLSEWINQCNKPVCWLSLDERDNNPHRFIKYFIVALQRLNSAFGENAFLELQSSQPLQTEIILTHIINEIIATAEPFVFVMDDYHVITDPEIQQMLLFLLDHMPSQMHLIISSRSDPPWPLSRLKVRDEILEIRSQEMRFTLEEAAAFLNDMMGLALSPENIATLERRTEGWVVGLYLAALSMRQRPNKDAFIQAFTGSNRYVVDYLVEEVIDLQPPDIQEFLLKTSILARLTGSLCDVLLDRQDSQTVLRDLEQKNLFLIPLDDERQWYRYHHLFADLLKHYLTQSFADEVVGLHTKASVWYEENDLFADAFTHALVANEIERIVQLTDEMAVYKLDYGECRALLDWLERLSEALIAQYPWLLVTQAWTLFHLGKYEAVEANLAEIERALSPRALPSEDANRIQGHVAAIRSNLAEIREDPQTAMHLAEDAFALLSDKDVKLRAFVAIRWANCLVWFGDLERAILIYQEAGEASKRVGEDQLTITALSEMAMTLMIAGKLRQAIECFTEITNYAETLAKRDGRQLPAMGILYRHMSYIKREQNELAEADHYAREAIKICKQWGEKESYLFALMALSRVQFDQGDIKQVEENFQQIIQIAGEISPLYAAQFKSWIIHYQLIMRKTEAVENWVEDLSLKADEAFGYDKHLDYLNYAHYLSAEGFYNQALEVVNNLIKVVSDVGAGWYLIRYKVLQAILLNRLTRVDEAIVIMGQALSCAHTEGYVRAVLDEGEAIGDLLQISIAQGVEVGYASKLLFALRAEARPFVSRTFTDAGLVDPLSQREMEVLRLFVTDLTAPEIADELIISASTVRSHIKNIYSKLDVHSRYEAVRKAKEINLL
jgi:LuxR family transcriptional regulator, maltose regulon positive regulatory protein